MAYRGPVDRRLLHALGPMLDLPCAEAWRRLAPVAGRLGVRRPSYPTVRRGLLVHRQLEGLRRRRSERDQILASDLLAGRVPYRWLHEVIVGVPLFPEPDPPAPRPPPEGRRGGGR